MAKVKAIPEGYSTVVSYISVKGASDAIAFYKKAFGAEELMRMPMPDGTVGHAELKIGDSVLMLADEMDHPQAISKSPKTLGGVTSGLCLYVEDADAVFNRAVAAGGKVRRPLTNHGSVRAQRRLTGPPARTPHWKVMPETNWLMSQLAFASVWLVMVFPCTLRLLK